MKSLSVFLLSLTIILFSITLVISNIPFYMLAVENFSENAPIVYNLLSYFLFGTLNESYYSEIEILHLADVRNIIYAILSILFFSIILNFFLLKNTPKNVLSSIFRNAAISTAIFIILGAIPLFFFNSAFILFHKIFFTNNYWLLPADSTLIQLFPQRFFVLAFIQILIYSLILSALFYLGSKKWKNIT